MGGFTEVLVLDLGKPDDKSIISTIPEQYTPRDGGRYMQVSWQIDKKCQSGYALIGGGLACLEKPYICRKLNQAVLECKDSFYSYHYSTGSDGLLNMYVILPEGYTVRDWGSEFADVKSLNNRIVLIWVDHSIDCRLQIEKTRNRVDDEKDRISKRRRLPSEKRLPWFRLPWFPRDFGVQIGLLAAGATIAAVDAVPGVTNTPLGNVLLYTGLGLLIISALLIGAVRILDWIQK